MSEAHAVTQPELPNIVSVLAEHFPHNPVCQFLLRWENIFFSIIVIVLITSLAYLASRRATIVPSGRLQSAFEALVGGFDDFVCGILGPHGRKFTPFIGTLFIYIICMNLSGLIPFMKPATTSWSTTLGLALCVFFYLQYTSFKELGFLGYVDHLLGNPRGILAYTVFVPVLMFILHVVGELIRPISLSLRLRSNIWGDDMLLAVLANFGIIGTPLLFFNMLTSILAAVVQASVFCLLTTIYFALVLTHEE